MATQQTAQQQPATQQPAGPSDAQLVMLIAAGLGTAVVPPVAVAAIWKYFEHTEIDRLALIASMGIVMSMPPENAGFFGSATATIHRLNRIRSAQFVLHSARRLTMDLVRARSHNISLADALRRGVIRERRFYGQHLVAGWGRSNSAAAVDTASMSYGRMLGWYSVMDRKTSPECRAAHRHNFYADQMPVIGYPGAVHPHCRCYPGPPVPGAPLVGSNVPTGQRQRVYA